MTANETAPGSPMHKAPTGILGLDSICMVGIPQGRVTLVEGGPGAGKTVLALQVLVHGARDFREPGIFVAFEESSACIVCPTPAEPRCPEVCRYRTVGDSVFIVAPPFVDCERTSQAAIPH